MNSTQHEAQTGVAVETEPRRGPNPKPRGSFGDRDAHRRIVRLLCLFAAYLVVDEIVGKFFHLSRQASALMQFGPYCVVLAGAAYAGRRLMVSDKQTLLMVLCLVCVFFVFGLDFTRTFDSLRNVPILGEASRVRQSLSSVAIMIAIASFPAASYFTIEEIFLAKAKVDEQVEKLQHVEKALTLQKMILEAQNEASIDGMLMIDENRKVISHNRRFVEIWRLPQDSIQSWTDEMLLPILLEKVAEPGAVLTKIRKLYEQTDATARAQIALKDGRTLEHFSAPVRGVAGAHFGRIWVYRDVTEQIKAELELRRLYEQTRLDAETKTGLLREINHRVKNNLISILGLIQNQQRYTPNKEDRPVVKGTLEGLGQQIRGLIEVHQMLSGTQWSPVILSELAYRVITAAMRMKEARTQVTLHIAPSAVLVSPRHANSVGLALNELATNTLKYAAAGRTSTSITVRIEMESEWIRLEYRDDGPGFPAEVLSGQRQGVGLVLLQQLAVGAFRGSLSLSNQGGAMAVLRIKNDESDRT